MSTIDVGIGHDDDAMITKSFEIESFANTDTGGNDKIFDFFEFDDFVEPGPFGVENLAA